MRFTTKDLATLAVFGALWGSVEITLGAWLHAANAPFSGMLLAAVGVVIALTGRVFVPRRGSVVTISIVAALMKAFSVGGVVLYPMIAIVMEGALAELGLALGGRRRTTLPFLLAGAVAVSWSFAQPFVTQGLLAGAGVIEIYRRTLDQAAGVLRVDPDLAMVLLMVVALIHVVVGMAAGGAAVALSRQLASRLRSHTTARASGE